MLSVIFQKHIKLTVNSSKLHKLHKKYRRRSDYVEGAGVMVIGKKVYVWIRVEKYIQFVRVFRKFYRRMCVKNDLVIGRIINVIRTSD